MKIYELTEFQASADDCLDRARGEDIILLRDGHRIALVHDLRNEASEDLDDWIEDDPEIWAAIERGRTSPTSSFDEVAARLLGNDAEPVGGR